MELTAGDDYVGYETSFYSVDPAINNGVRLTFSSAEVVKNGKHVRSARPLLKLFDLGDGSYHVRLLFMVRESQADHDVAIVAAKNRNSLDETTRAVQANPDACHRRTEVECYWVPQGIAVRPERKDGRHWLPVL
jgi:hypothetical protein